MFKAIQNNKIISINETNNFPCLIYDRVEEDLNHTIHDYILTDTEFSLKTSIKGIERQKENVRQIRQDYFEKYVDWYQSKPLLWAEMNANEKEKISAYRQYLMDYTNQENWYLKNPLTFDEWKEN